MVRRKPVSKPGIEVEANTGCFKLERQQLLDGYKESKRKAGCDLKKMVKKGRSFKHSSMESSSKKAIPSKSSIGSSPNYMKPTSSSDAKRESLQVSLKSRTSVVSSTSKKSETSSKLKDVAGLKPSKSLSRSSSLRPLRPSMKKSCVVALHPKHNVGWPTCSSTLKDSKFPAYLDLHHGGTEVEGTSVVKVCPYTYCSLNGHFHEPLPPLKCFLAGKRKLLKAQKCLKLEEVPEIETKVCGGPVKEVDHPIEAESAMIVDEEGVDFFIEIYAKPKEECDIPLDFDQSSDQSCEMICEQGLYQGEFDHNCEEHGEESEEQVLENFLELLQSDMEEMGSNYSVCSDQDDWDEKFNYHPASEETNPIMSDSDKGEENEQMLEEDAESFTVEFNGDCDFMFGIVWIDEKEDQPVEELFDNQKEEEMAKEHAFSDHNIPEHNSNPDAAVELPPSEQDDYSLNQDEKEQDIEEEQSDLMQQNNTEPDMTDQVEETNTPLDNILSPQEAIIIDYSDQDPLPSIEQASESESEVALYPEKQDETEQPTIEEEPTTESKGIKPSIEPIYHDREWYKRKSRQAGEEDADMDREFNPRPPNFLPLEPDPDAEKVDLKHQMMEERKNAEEWMLDYALRSTVNKLGPARKRRVALLVEAFESVMPVHKCESRLPAAASCFTHTMHLQACN